MGAGDYQKYVGEAKSQEDRGIDNQFPDGEYTVTIDRVKLHNKDLKTFIFVEGEVFDGPYAGALMSCAWTLSQRDSVKYTVADITAFLKGCGTDCTLAHLDDPGVRAWFAGKRVKAKKETNGKYTNWKYWKAVEGGAVADSSEQPNLDEDVDLGPDPFKVDDDGNPLQPEKPAQPEQPEIDLDGPDPLGAPLDQAVQDVGGEA